MSVRDLLMDLDAHGVVLRADGHDLRVEAQKGTLTPELVAEIAAHKTELLDAVRRPRVGICSHCGRWAAPNLLWMCAACADALHEDYVQRNWGGRHLACACGIDFGELTIVEHESSAEFWAEDDRLAVRDPP